MERIQNNSDRPCPRQFLFECCLQAEHYDGTADPQPSCTIIVTCLVILNNDILSIRPISQLSSHSWFFIFF